MAHGQSYNPSQQAFILKEADTHSISIRTMATKKPWDANVTLKRWIKKKTEWETHLVDKDGEKKSRSRNWTETEMKFLDENTTEMIRESDDTVLWSDQSSAGLPL